MEGQNDHSVSSDTSNDTETAAFRKLWLESAGPLAILPRENELVFYFPQGNIEQVEVSNNDVADQEMPLFDLPFKILCRVINVQLLADPSTDEVFALVALIPEENQNENAVEKEPQPPSLPPFRGDSFCKKLTKSDATANRFSVVKRHAENCLPKLGGQDRPLSQELVAKDLHGNEWKFRHTFRGVPARHLFEGTWNLFVSSKRMVAGDTFIFVSGENGELCVGVRRAMRQQGNVPLLDVSHQTMKAGLLCIVQLANKNKTNFTVHYRPRTSPAVFIVPYDQYLKSMKNNYSIGMSFRMKFEGEDEKHSVQSYTGTIVEVEDADPDIWKNSKWKCLKVSWDKTSTIRLPERVSPWEIAPALAARGSTSYRATSSQRTPSSQDPSTPIAQLTQEVSRLNELLNQQHELLNRQHETIVRELRLRGQNNDEHGTLANDRLVMRGDGADHPVVNNHMDHDLPDNLQYNLPENSPDNLLDNLLDNLPDNLDNFPDNLLHNSPDNLLYNFQDHLPDNLLYNFQDNLPDNSPDNMPDNLPDFESPEMQEWMGQLERDRR